MSSDGDDFVDPMGAASADERLQEGQTVGEERRREKGTGSAKGREEKDEEMPLAVGSEGGARGDVVDREISEGVSDGARGDGDGFGGEKSGCAGLQGQATPSNCPMHADFRCGKLPTAGEEPCVWRKLSLRAWIGYCRGTSFPTTFEDVDLSDYTASQLVLVCHVWQNERLWASERVETIRKKDFEGVEVEAHSIRSAWIGLTKICRCCLVESLMKVVYPDAEGWRSFVPRELPDLQEIWKCVKRGDDGFPKWNRLWKDVWVLERTVLEKLNGHLVSDFGYILPFTEESLLKAKGMGDLRRVYVSLPLATKEGQLESCLDRINHLCQKKGVSALILTPLLPIENILDFNKLCKEYVNKITGWKENMEKSKRRIHISANMYDGEGWIPFGSHAAALRTTTRLTTADVAAYGLQLGNDLKKYSVRHMFVKGNLRHVNGSPKAPSVSERAGYHPLSGVEPSSGKRRGCAADSAVPPKRGFYRG